MREFEHIEKMRSTGKLSEAQAKLLEDSLKASKQRKTKIKPSESDPEDDGQPSTGKCWMVLGGLFLLLLSALVFSVGNKSLFFLLLLLIVSLGCAAAVFLIFFNVLVWKKEGVERTRALIANEVERKAALVPQIQESVSAYAGHESETYKKVVQERTAKADGPKESELNLRTASIPFQALVESYPEIKSNQHYMQLVSELVETENRIIAMVKWYNHIVSSYNGTIEAFPFSIVAEAFSFKKAIYLESV